MVPQPTRRGTLMMSPSQRMRAVPIGVTTVLKSAWKNSSARLSSTSASPRVSSSALIGSRAVSRASSGDTSQACTR